MLESLKKDVVAMAKRAQKEGLCKHLSGNLSARRSRNRICSDHTNTGR